MCVDGGDYGLDSADNDTLDNRVTDNSGYHNSRVDVEGNGEQNSFCYELPVLRMSIVDVKVFFVLPLEGVVVSFYSLGYFQGWG